MYSQKRKNPHLLWHICLAIVFLCFGMLIMAQYNTHLTASNALENESAANLVVIQKSVNDNKSALEDELAQLQNELRQAEEAIANGESLYSTTQTRIDSLKTAIGWWEVTGPGISVSITGSGNLVYWDIIQIVNELMNAGAEAIAINDIRFTSRTLISEASRLGPEVFNPETEQLEQDSYNYITINGQELLAPIVIKALGDASTLDTALTYSGGIVDSFNTHYGATFTIRHAEKLKIPAAVIPEFKYAATVEAE